MIKRSAAVGEMVVLSSSLKPGADIALETDPASGLLMLKAKVPPPPDNLAPIIGDCVHNLRSALDHIVWQLVIANKKTPTASNMFPIWETPQKFKGQVAQ